MAAIFDLCKYGGKNTASACVLILNALSDHQLLSCQKEHSGDIALPSLLWKGGGVGGSWRCHLQIYTHTLTICYMYVPVVSVIHLMFIIYFCISYISCRVTLGILTIHIISEYVSGCYIRSGVHITKNPNFDPISTFSYFHYKS